MNTKIFSALFVGLTVMAVAWAQGDFQKGISYYKQGQYAKAATEFEQLVEENPDYEAGFRILGDCYLKLKDYAKAADAFSRAVEIKNNRFDSLFGLGVAQFNLERYQDSVATLKRAERFAQSPREKYQLFHTRGAAYYNLDNFSMAIADLEQAVSIQRGEFRDVFQLGVSYLRVNRVSEAKQYLEQAAALRPDSTEAKQFLARLDFQSALSALQSKNYRAATDQLKQYLEQNPEDGEAWFNLGLAQLFSDNLKDAETSFLQSVKRRPNQWEPYNRLGFIYEKNEQYQKSLQNYKKALSLHRDPALQESVERVEERIRRQKESG